MSKARRTWLIVAAVVVLVVVAASVAVRVILTPEKLRELVVPRIERAARASVSFETIGVRFPFGFGVDIGGLAVEKTTAGGETLAFSARETVVRAKLLSLIRRKPEIDRVEFAGASLRLSGAPGGRRVDVLGLDAVMSAKPAGETFDLRASVRADTVIARLAGGAPPLTLERIDLVAAGAIDAAYANATIEEATIRWGNLATVVVAGNLSDLHDRRVIDLEATVPETAAGPLAARLLSMLGSVDPDRGERGFADTLPVDVTGGAISATARARGSLALVSDMGLDGEISLAGVAIAHPALAVPVELTGAVSVTDRAVSADAVDLVLGRSTATAGFRLDMANGFAPEKATVSLAADVDLADLLVATRTEGIDGAGSIRLTLEAAGRPAALTTLFPSGLRENAPKAIGWAWRNTSVAGAIETADVSLAGETMPLGIDDLAFSATIAGGDVEGIDARWMLDGRPWRMTGSITGVLPAAAEMAFVAGGRPAATLGELLDGMENVPDARLDISGRALDVRPFQAAAAAGGKKAAATPPAGGGGEEAVSPAGPAVVLLKKTAFTARLDTLIMEAATVTEIDSRGRAADGRVTIDPVRFRYAGGEGRAVARVDLRDAARIETDLDVSLQEVDAAAALSPFSTAAGIVSGTFSVESTARLLAGEALDPLATLIAEGTASSSRARLELDRFIAPLAASAPVDLSSLLGSIDVRSLVGAFSVADGRVFTEDWELASSTGDWLVRGSFGFDGSINYDVRLAIPPAVQQGMKDLAKYGDLVDLLRDDSGTLRLHFTVGGTATKPTAVLDLAAAKKKGAEKLFDQLKKKFLE